MENLTIDVINKISEQKDKELFIRLGEVRQRILRTIESSNKTKTDRLLNTGNYIGISSIIGILFLLIVGFSLQFIGLLPSRNGGIILLTVFGILLAGCVFATFAFFLSALLKFINFLRRNEIDRALESYEQISKYVDEGQKSFSDFDLATLERAAERVEKQVDSTSTDNGFFDSILKYLPAAVGYATLVVFALFLFDARAVTAILGDPQVTNLTLFQQKVSGHVFTAITSSFHPFAIYNILMLAFIFTASMKITPVLINISAVRRFRRYRDYLNILEEAIQIKNEQESQKLTAESSIAASISDQLPPPAAAEVFQTAKEKVISRSPKNGTSNKSRKRK